MDWLAPAYSSPFGMLFAPVLLGVGIFSKVLQASYSRDIPEGQSGRKESGAEK